MVVVPAETPVTNPVPFMVATAVFDETQALVVAGVAEPVNCVCNPIQTANVPAMVGKALTVTSAVVAHPPALV